MNKPSLPFLAMIFLSLCAAALRAAPKVPGYANDLGPEVIDVSGYPMDQQEAYKKFQTKCVVCHGAARAVNAEFITAEEWNRYIKRMWLRPPCCNICPTMSKADAKVIWKFLTYDSQIRKTGDRAAAWGKHRQTLLAEFKAKYPKKYQELYEPNEQKGRNSL